MLSPQTRTLLSRYTLAPRVLNALSGERLSREAGQSLEFYDVRPYGVGDELRYVDWKAYARTGKLFTRLFQAERTSALNILLDSSPSMMLGGKWAAAQRLAAMLTYISLGMRTQVYRFGGEVSLRGGQRKQLPELWRFIEATPESATVTPSAALQSFAASAQVGSGMVVVLSDLFDEASLQPSLIALRTRRLDVCFVQLMGEDDLGPEPVRLDLRDSETGERLEVGPEEVRLYQEAVRAFLNRTRSAVLQAGFRYLFAPVGEDDAPFSDAELLAGLYRAGILARR